MAPNLVLPQGLGVGIYVLGPWRQCWEMGPGSELGSEAECQHGVQTRGKAAMVLRSGPWLWEGSAQGQQSFETRAVAS